VSRSNSFERVVQKHCSSSSSSSSTCSSTTNQVYGDSPVCLSVCLSIVQSGRLAHTRNASVLILPVSSSVWTNSCTSQCRGRLGSRVVSVLDPGAEGPGFRVTVLGKLFTPICLCSPSSKIGSSPLKGCEGSCRPGGKEWQPTAGFMTHVTCRLTAKNRNQLRNPTLGNRVCVVVEI